jgi:hypothetical protein
MRSRTPSAFGHGQRPLEALPGLNDHSPIIARCPWEATPFRASAAPPPSFPDPPHRTHTSHRSYSSRRTRLASLAAPSSPTSPCCIWFNGANRCDTSAAPPPSAPEHRTPLTEHRSSDRESRESARIRTRNAKRKLPRRGSGGSREEPPTKDAKPRTLSSWPDQVV